VTREVSTGPAGPDPQRSPGALPLALVEAVRRRCLETAVAAYEDAGLQGLCADGRWEAAIGAMRSLDPAALLREMEGERPAP
jgi:hypothetical protein